MKEKPICIKDWETYLSLDSCGDSDLENMISAAARFCMRFRDGMSPCWFTLLGNTGTGKSHCANKVWEKLSRRINWTRFDFLPGAIYWPKMVSDLRAGEAYERIGEMARWPLLFLDDIGSERDTSGFASDQLCSLLGQRARKWTIITSNKNIDQIAETDVRLADRIVREPGNQLVELKTMSYALRRHKGSSLPYKD